MFQKIKQRAKQQIHPKRRYISMRLHGITLQNIVIWTCRMFTVKTNLEDDDFVKCKVPYICRGQEKAEILGYKY
jgi:hypothetical protein